MKTYELTYRRSVAKDLRAVPANIRKAIVTEILGLAKDPKPHGSIKLKGQKDLFRLRHGDYRIIYQVDEKVITVLIIKVGHRKAVYKGL